MSASQDTAIQQLIMGRSRVLWSLVLSEAHRPRVNISQGGCHWHCVSFSAAALSSIFVPSIAGMGRILRLS